MICLMVSTVNHQRMSHCLRSTGDLIIIYIKKTLSNDYFVFAAFVFVLLNFLVQEK